MMGLFSLRPFSSPVICTTTNGSKGHHTLDASFIKHAAKLADNGFTAPHPNFGCVIAVNSGTMLVGEGYPHAQGTNPAELQGQAVEAAGEYCKGATAYVNMEPGDCHGRNY